MVFEDCDVHIYLSISITVLTPPNISVSFTFVLIITPIPLIKPVKILIIDNGVTTLRKWNQFHNSPFKVRKGGRTDDFIHVNSHIVTIRAPVFPDTRSYLVEKLKSLIISKIDITELSV